MMTPLEEAQALALQEERERATKPQVMTPTRFMEIRTIYKTELINIDTISEVYPWDWNDQDCTRIILVNGEDVTVLHTYEDIKKALRHYYK